MLPSKGNHGPLPRALAVVALLTAGAATAAGCGASIVVIECEDDLELCGQRCVDIQRNEDHCGGCDEVCEGVCEGGTCRVDPLPCKGPGCEPETCDGGTTRCDGACVDTQSDLSHCGACGTRCGDAERCDAGQCVDTCACGRCDTIDLASEIDVVADGNTFTGVDAYAPTCSGAGAIDVAFRFVAPASGYYRFDTAGSDYDTVLALLLDCTETSCVDDTAESTQASVVTYLDAGAEVVAIVDGYGTSFGSYHLHVFLTDQQCPDGLEACGDACVDVSSDPQNCGGCFIPCAEGELCADFTCQCDVPGCGCEFPICGGCNVVADLGSDVQVHYSGSTAGLSDDLAPTCSGVGSSDALHLFIAPFEGQYTFDTIGSSYDTVLAVYDTATCGELACNDDFVDLDSRVIVDLFAGQQILVVVDGLGDAGPYELEGFLTARR